MKNYSVSKNEVQLLASSLNFNQINLKSSSITKKEIEDIFEISENSKVFLYVVNFKKDRGFIVLAADRRAYPILAYSTKGKIDLKNLRTGLSEWLYNQQVYVENIENVSYQKISLNKMVWEELESIPSGVPDPEPNPDFPTTTITIKGPLLSTKWGQRCGYNSMCPPTSDGPCGFSVTGCLATAMAQIMKYHNYPTDYNWSSMPNTYGNLEVARLMRDIGDAVNMKYGGASSSADTPEEARDAFVNNFGYSSSAKYIEYNGSQSKVEQQINWGHPVLMRGGEKKYWADVIPYYGGGHAWVCHGYKRVDYEFEGVQTSSYLYLYMN